MAGSFVLCVCALAQRTVYLAVVSSNKPLRAVGLLGLAGAGARRKEGQSLPTIPGALSGKPRVDSGRLAAAARALQWEAKSTFNQGPYAGNCRF
jgi:hypothetical protein